MDTTNRSTLLTDSSYDENSINMGEDWLMKQITQIIEALTLRICESVYLIPAPIKHFARAIFDYYTIDKG